MVEVGREQIHAIGDRKGVFGLEKLKCVTAVSAPSKGSSKLIDYVQYNTRHTVTSPGHGS